MIFNWENNKYRNQTQETMNMVFFLGETINGENPATSPDSNNLFLPSPSVFFFLSYVLQLSVSECVSTREASSLFILIPDLTKPN